MAEGDQISNVNLDEIDNPEGKISVINIWNEQALVTLVNRQYTYALFSLDFFYVLYTRM
jgi:hypothetical protein